MKILMNEKLQKKYKYQALSPSSLLLFITNGPQTLP